MVKKMDLVMACLYNISLLVGITVLCIFIPFGDFPVKESIYILICFIGFWLYSKISRIVLIPMVENPDCNQEKHAMINNKGLFFLGVFFLSFSLFGLFLMIMPSYSFFWGMLFLCIGVLGIWSCYESRKMVLFSIT